MKILRGRTTGEGVVSRFAKQSSSIAAIHTKIDQFEDGLESKIRAEEQKPRTKFQKIRLKGGHVLLSKYVLVVVVALCVLDCILVVAELILDIYAIREEAVEDRGSSSFSHGVHNDGLPGGGAYSKQHRVVPMNHADLVKLHNSFIHRGAIEGNMSKPELTHAEPYIHETNSHVDGGHHPVHQEIAHTLHRISIAILSILVCYTFMKIVCQGRKFLTKKIEVFDAIMVVLAFILDLVYLEGITTKPIQESAYILSYILPWRAIRVINSLVVAVLDNEQFKLLIVYKSKKDLKTEFDETKDDVDLMRKQVHKLKALCIQKGVAEWVVNRRLLEMANQKKGRHIFTPFASPTAMTSENGGCIPKRQSVSTGDIHNHDSSDEEEYKTLIEPRSSHGRWKNSSARFGGETSQHSNRTAPSVDSGKGNNDITVTRGQKCIPLLPEKKLQRESVHFDDQDIAFADDD